MPYQRSSGGEILVGDGGEDAADLERLLPPRIGGVGEDLAHGPERATVGEVADVAVAWVAGRGETGEALAWSCVGVLVVAEQKGARLGKVAGPVLRLAVGTHDPRVAADPEVVLGGDAPRRVEHPLAGEHHRPLRRHDQDAAGMHEHRGLGVPVGLGAGVDARHHNIDLGIDLGARLRELHQPAEHAGDPVHALGAAVERDAGAAGEGEPLDRRAHLAREVERGEDPPAFGLRQRSQVPAGIAEEDDARHSLRIARGEVADHPHHDVGGVAAVRTVHRHQEPCRVEVVLDEVAAAGRQPLDHLVGIGEAAAAQVHHFLGILPQRLQRRLGWLAEAEHRPRLLEAGDLQHQIAKLAALAVGDPAADRHLLQPHSLGERCQAAHQEVDLVRRQIDRRPDVEQHPVPGQPLGGGAARLEAAHPGERFHQHVLELRQLHEPAGLVAHRCEVAHLGHGEQPLVARVLAGDAVEEVDLFRRRQAVEMEVPQPPELQPQGHHGVDAAVDLLLLERAAGLAPEGEVLRAGRPGDGDRHAAQSRRRGERQQGRDLGGYRGLRRRFPRAPEVEVHHHLRAGGRFAGEAARGLDAPGEAVVVRVRGDQVDVGAPVLVAGDAERLPLAAEALDRLPARGCGSSAAP